MFAPKFAACRQQSLVVRRASATDRPRLEAFCRERGYLSVLSPEAAIVLAERGRDVVGLGRVQVEEDVLVLRGLGVDARCRRRGIGSRLLALLLEEVGDRCCYCIAYAHLRAFYGRAGFAVLDLDSLPAFLRDRVLQYRSAGNEVLPMCRPGTSEPVPSSAR